MYSFSHTVTVNSANGQPVITRQQLWQGLVLKAEDPTSFIDGMESSVIVARTENSLLREVIFQGRTVREQVTFDPPNSVSFQQVDAQDAGAVINTIEGEGSTLALTFTFSLRFTGVEENSNEEQVRGEQAAPRLKDAVDHTIKTVQYLVSRGELT